MHSDADRLDIPQQIYKFSHEDNERTRLLKDVLRNSVALQEDGAGGKKQPRKVALSLMQAPQRTTRKDRVKRSGSLALSTMQENDAVCTELAGVADMSPLLRSCGTRVSGLAATLHASDRRLKEMEERDKAEHQASSSADPHGEIRIMDRPEEDPRAIRARNDRVVYDFIAKHARFHKLEEFKAAVDEAEGYEGMRELIPRRTCVPPSLPRHPNMVLLDDKVLTDPRKLRRAMWSTAPSKAEEAKARESAVASAKKAARRLNVTVDLSPKQSTTKRAPTHSSGVNFRRSAPALL